MADLARIRNEELARILHQLAWSPERLAREVNLVLAPGLAISQTAPYKWRDRGMVPRSPHDQAVCEVLSRAVGIAVTYEQLWGRMGSHRGAKALSARLLTDPWTADTAQIALHEAGLQVAPVRLTDLFRGDELARAAQHWSAPPPPLTGGSGALLVTADQLNDLQASCVGKRRLGRACGGGLVLESARAELAMVGKLLELGGYAEDEPLGRALYGAAGRLARLVGWAGADLGQEAAAQRAYVAALRAAHVAGSRSWRSAWWAAWRCSSPTTAPAAAWTRPSCWARRWPPPGRPWHRSNGRASWAGWRWRTVATVIGRLPRRPPTRPGRCCPGTPPEPNWPAWSAAPTCSWTTTSGPDRCSPTRWPG